MVVSREARSARIYSGRQTLLPDTHAHLDADAFGGELTDVIRRAQEAGIGRILTVGSDLASSRRAIELANQFDSVFAAVGVHPHEAEKFQREADGVRDLLAARKVVAVGEIGLDYHRQGTSREAQLEAFREQIRWAREANVPVSIHNRDADGDVLGELRASGVRAILHCFSGSGQFAAEALAQGYYLSFAGNVTFPRAAELRLTAAEVPVSRILVESDAPVLAPQPWRGRRNEPAYVTATASGLATILSIPEDELAAAISASADDLFGWRAA